MFDFLGCIAIVGKGIRLPWSIYVDPILHLCVRTLGEIFKSYEASHRVYFVQYSVASMIIVVKTLSKHTFAID